MESPSPASDIVAALTEAFGQREWTDRPRPEEIERVLRPFAPVPYEVETRVEELLSKNHDDLADWVGSWFEANDVVLNHGDHVEKRIQFLLRDTCTCVLDHPPAARAHATGPVDSRILALLEHPPLTHEKI